MEVRGVNGHRNNNRLVGSILIQPIVLDSHLPLSLDLKEGSDFKGISHLVFRAGPSSESTSSTESSPANSGGSVAKSFESLFNSTTCSGTSCTGIFGS